MKKLYNILITMIENLFGSKTRFKLLELFMSNPNQVFYVRQITNIIDEQINSVRRELSNLLSLGIIKADNSGKHLYYEVDQSHPKYRHLKGLLASSRGQEIVKTVDSKGRKIKNAGKKVTKAKKTSPEKALGNVTLVVLTGIFTLDKKAPADLLIVGNVTDAKLEAYVSELEKPIDKEIKYVCLNQDDFDYRYMINDRFIKEMLSSKIAVRVDRNNVTKTKPSK